jgi:hypothetical protein
VIVIILINFSRPDTGKLSAEPLLWSALGEVRVGSARR